MYRYSLKIILLSFFYLIPSYGQALTQWMIIPSESYLRFSAMQHDSPVSGEFKNFRGELFVDATHIENSHIHITIDIKSLLATNAELTETLKTTDWFNVSAFPSADYEAHKFKQIDNKTYQAFGILTIRHQSAPVTLTFSAEKTADNHALVIGNTTIKRTVFGVGQGAWSETNEIGDNVNITFKIVAASKN